MEVQTTQFKRSILVDGVIDFTAGTAGGIANVYIGQPLDTVKVKMQTFPTLYRNALHCFTDTFKKDGIIKGLYAGTGPSLVANISENAILFLFYGFCQKAIVLVTRHRKVEDLSPIHNAFAGSGAAFFCAFALCPTELVKCRLQAMREMKGAARTVGPWAVTKEVLHAEGIPGLYKGLTSTILREMPGYFFFFGGYELTRHLFIPKGGTKEDVGPVGTIISGGVGGLALWTAIFPADVVKSRIQVQSTVGKAAPSFLSVFLTVLKTEGVAALYKGLGPTLLRTFPSTGGLFLTVELTKKYMGLTADYFHL
ncbi:mitochondrial ornithine transporter 1 [Octopus bimaculoides]|uniref:mitochondrial ornithine transporter 1 n=1 Tax=Octopus bimaculoides TaxID=37653 RepID=UPI0022E6AFE0|nr:mitochondrial ornithine transporter 1 [Octopus bimaculoides]XP_052828372.1 mitochondrial ornithine transporter 1 [Octopus bimaculoides]XP_052828373.1 mitochondrial ornithine transporter 1 [Octopus bimaculoides]XP_052828374.1 mitochondrial ornithine transporter 1 [Octopus bimaculoides]XP_052828375.1 mitochondrial ornithine transporter 1 [Octopus bimaculoides]XP_052828376.1 mitochondrial ornithine transporter 1 [Octopus bimaculoides]XP_052828377.1 mitochondrial ornithine transporter 1 [Octop